MLLVSPRKGTPNVLWSLLEYMSVFGFYVGMILGVVHGINLHFDLFFLVPWSNSGLECQPARDHRVAFQQPADPPAATPVPTGPPPVSSLKCFTMFVDPSNFLKIFKNSHFF